MVLLSAMASSDVGAILGAVQWSEEGNYVKEVVAKGNLPLLAKAIKGQYLSIGVPSIASPGLSSTVFLLSAGKPLRVAAQSVKFKEGRKVVPVGPKLAIPESYDGYFEILSEDGRAVRCIETVAELIKRFPDSCLVRESIKAYVSRSDDVDTITEKSRSVLVGETLILVGEVVGNKTGKGTQQRYLRCFDQNGHNVYLPVDAKGKFSAIAKEDNISGVHSIKNLLNKRLPLMVRLIHGRPPSGPKLSQFLPELRLFASFTEEAFAAIPVGKDAPLVLLPPSAPLKLTQCRNFEVLQKTKEFASLCERSANLLREMMERIYVYDVNVGTKNGIVAGKDPRFFKVPETVRQWPKHSYPHHRRPSKLKTPTDKNPSDGMKLDDYDEIDQIYDYVRGFAPLPKHIKSYSLGGENESLARRMSAPAVTGELKPEVKPIPPPIETIPSRKGTSMLEKLSPSVHPALISAVLEKAQRKGDKNEKKPDKAERKVEKRLRNSDESSKIRVGSESKGSSKLFIKANQHKLSKSRLLRHKSISPVKEASLDLVSSDPAVVLTPCRIPGKTVDGVVTGKSPSPLFKMRYKSLTNLVMDFDTIDSSTSGGKNSTDSCGSLAYRSKIPEKRSRRLLRPRSLTNLFWDGRGNNSFHVDMTRLGGRSSGRAMLEAEKKLRLEPGVYRHARDTPALIAATSRMLSSQKKVGTLYI